MFLGGELTKKHITFRHAVVQPQTPNRKKNEKSNRNYRGDSVLTELERERCRKGKRSVSN